MNGWFSLLATWLIDFGWLATALLAVAIVMRAVLHDSSSRVLLAWGTWLGIAAAAVIAAVPWWPRFEVARLWIVPPAVVGLPQAVEDEVLSSQPIVFVELASRAQLQAVAVSLSPPRPAWTWTEALMALWL